MAVKKEVKYSSGECEVKLGDVVENESVNGLKWVLKYERQPDPQTKGMEDVTLCWEFEWDSDDVKMDGVKGFEGKIHVLRETGSRYEPMVFDVKFRKNAVIKKKVKSIKTEKFEYQWFNYKVHVAALTDEYTYPEGNFEPSELTDAILLVEEKKLNVNKQFLSFQSEFFRALFNSEFNEKSMPEIPIEGVECEEFACFLSVLYPKPYSPNDFSAETLLKLADRFLMPAVTHHVEQYLLFQSELAHCKNLLLADKYGLKKLKDKMMEQFKTRESIKELSLTLEYVELTDKTKVDLLERLL